MRPKITPFHAPGSALGKAGKLKNIGFRILCKEDTIAHSNLLVSEAATGIFTPAQPFSCMKSVGHNAAIIGTIMGVQRFTSKSLELIRQREDIINDLTGFVVTYKYYSYFIGSSEKRLIRHNKIFGGIAIMTVLYSALV
jgi:hypothetical protein